MQLWRARWSLMHGSADGWGPEGAGPQGEPQQGLQHEAHPARQGGGRRRASTGLHPSSEPLHGTWMAADTAAPKERLIRAGAVGSVGFKALIQSVRRRPICPVWWWQECALAVWAGGPPVPSGYFACTIHLNTDCTLVFDSHSTGLLHGIGVSCGLTLPSTESSSHNVGLGWHLQEPHIRCLKPCLRTCLSYSRPSHMPGDALACKGPPSWQRDSSI